MRHKKTVFILSITSDIGRFLGKYYADKGYEVIGTYRHLSDAHALNNCQLIKCDVSKQTSINALIRALKLKRIKWDVFISCVGEPRPVMPFFESDIDQWQQSVEVNCLAQLRVLHGLYPMRQSKADVIFFAGGGMNNAVKNFSAYTASKIFLTKMCEFLDMENKDLKFAIIGPGWTKTKIHQTILNDQHSCKVKVKETKAFLKAKQGTAMIDIAQCIDWILTLPKEVVSGRNFSVVYDPWRQNQRFALEKALKNNKNMYKLRREGNEYKVEQ